MNVKRVVNTSFWDDDLVIEKFTAEDKYFMLYILTNRYTNQLGIYHFPVKNVAFDMGYSKDSVYGLIDRFENKYNVIRFSQATNEIAIINYLRHSIVSGGKPVMDCLIKDEKNVKDKSLVTSVINHLSYYTIENNTINDFINYLKEKYNENKNDNDNDNDNEESYHDSYHDSLAEVVPKDIKHKYGEYKNVMLKDSEYDKLAEDFGVEMRNKCITFLDEYIEEKGYKSKSHNLAIRRWVVDAVKRKGNANTNGGIDWSKV